MPIPQDEWEKVEDTVGPMPIVRFRYDVWARIEKKLQKWARDYKCTLWQPYVVMPDDQTFINFRIAVTTFDESDSDD